MICSPLLDVARPSLLRYLTEHQLNRFLATAYQQTLFARIVNITTGEITYISYPLNVNPAPSNPTVSITNCANATTSFPCWDLTSVEAQIAQGAAASIVTFFTSQADAFSNVAQIANPSCYISPTASPVNPPVFYGVENTVTGCFAVGVVGCIVTGKQIGRAHV